MVDFKLLLNPPIESVLVRRKCRKIKKKCDSRVEYQIKNNRNFFQDETPKIRKRWIFFIIVILIICIGVGVAYPKGVFSHSEKIEPPNPIMELPPSPSKLRIFKKAAVCADGAICAEIGKSVLEKNGSAVDATLATMFCNGIFAMQSMGLGGGFLMTIYIRQNQTAYTLNAREKAPQNAKPELYKTNKLKSQTGPLSIAVPGELKGYHAAHQRFGKLKWEEIIQPSIELCEKGYEMSDHQYTSILKSSIMNYSDTNLMSWFLDSKGEIKKTGSKIIPKKLCETLKIIASNGANDLYTGNLSQLLIKDLQDMSSIIVKEDLESYEAQWMDPITVELNTKEKIYTVPPPGSGALLGFIMNILQGYHFKRDDIADVNSTVNTYHKIIEAFKYAYAKRTELGDMNFINITELLHNLTSTEYAKNVRLRIADKTTLDPKHYGAVFYNNDDHGTAHISVLAENGDAVSVTSSINIYFGAGLTSKRTGIILNSVMDDFSFPYFKNYFGLPGSPHNELKPGKRPLSSMTPTILVDEKGDVKLVIGASGGTKITTSVAWAIIRSLWFKDNIKEAVDAPRLHHQLFPMKVEYEYGILQQIVEGLEALGHKMERYTGAGSIICALYKEAEKIFANADYRKGGDVYGIN